MFSGAEIDTLRKLARYYPAGLDDGDIPAKSGRDNLVERGFVRRDTHGMNYCTKAGLEAEFANPPPSGSRADIARSATEHRA